MSRHDCRHCRGYELDNDPTPSHRLLVDVEFEVLSLGCNCEVCRLSIVKRTWGLPGEFLDVDDINTRGVIKSEKRNCFEIRCIHNNNTRFRLLSAVVRENVQWLVQSCNNPRQMTVRCVLGGMD